MLVQHLFKDAQETKDPHLALEKFNRLLKTIEAQAGVFDMGACEVLAYISGLEFDIEHYSESIESAKKALNILAFLSSEDYILRSQLYNNIAMSYWVTKDSEKAQEHFEYLWRLLQKQKEKEFVVFGVEDYKNFCYRTQNYEKLVEIASFFDVPGIVYTYLKDNQPVVFNSELIFCCTDTKYGQNEQRFSLGKVIYFQLIPLAIESNATLSFHEDDPGRKLLEEFSKAFTSA